MAGESRLNGGTHAVRSPIMVTTRPLPDHLKFFSAIHHPGRWQMLRALSAGEVMAVTEFSEVVGCSVDMSSKHLKMLKAVGLVIQKRNLALRTRTVLPARAGRNRCWTSTIACCGSTPPGEC